ncbi:hypothetical protein LR48_Vigan03g257200 [Vigna angularis]|uniref:Uncharacterized protein n=1 Tax=Phaseolus angularis TaxID=3914 RepID=A0A0L9U8N8_PHAAN|nr:hypothetical protein LR48_Vigan03g257200 [Vigna angularis]
MPSTAVTRGSSAATPSPPPSWSSSLLNIPTGVVVGFTMGLPRFCCVKHSLHMLSEKEEKTQGGVL